MENENKEVKKPEEGGEPSKPQENVPSPEVKLEVKPDVKPEAKPTEVDANKDKDQISNLNIAVKQEREERKKAEQKISEFENQLKSSSDTIERLKSAFSSDEGDKTDEIQYMTKEDADQYFQQMFDEQKKKQEDEKKSGLIKQEITELEKDYNGADGKPKYEDQEVLNWQKEQDKLYLSPREAFLSMKKDEIIDWEVKQRLAGKKSVEDVEKPSGIESNHTPQENVPKTDQETRQAVLEAMENVEKEI